MIDIEAWLTRHQEYERLGAESKSRFAAINKTRLQRLSQTVVMGPQQRLSFTKNNPITSPKNILFIITFRQPIWIGNATV